jgi:hypothetical protein
MPAAKNHEPGDPQDVHHAADKQQGHQHPAATYTAETVTSADDERANGVAVKPAASLDKLQRRLTLAQACVLQRAPLV